MNREERIRRLERSAASSKDLALMIVDLEDQVLKYERALTEIRDGRIPQVCPEFEICKHEGCSASYAAFAIADEALKD